MTILLADDDRVMRTLTATFLKRSGFELLYAQDAAQVLQIVKSTVPDMFVLDIMMPGISGVELCRALRAHEATRGTPVIMLSSLNDPQTINNCLNAGATAFVCKSDMQRLPAIVRKFLPAPTPGPLSRQEAQAGIDAK